jgi:hypothetical protein
LDTKKSNRKIIKEKTVENYFHAILYDNDVIDLTWDTSVTCVEIDHLMRARDVFFEFGNGKKMPIYFSTHDFLQTSDAARKLAVTEEYGKYSLTNAVLINSMAMRIIFNFFNRFYKPTVLTVGFPTKESALEWLHTIQKEKNTRSNPQKNANHEPIR